MRHFKTFESFQPKRVEDRAKDKEAKFFIKKNNGEIDNVIRALRDYKEAHDKLNQMWVY